MLDNVQNNMKCSEFKIHDVYLKFKNEREKQIINQKYDNLKIYESHQDIEEAITLRSSLDT